MPEHEGTTPYFILIVFDAVQALLVRGKLLIYVCICISVFIFVYMQSICLSLLLKFVFV